MTMGNIPGLATFINVVIGVAVVIGFIVIFQAMYAAVMERTREIGILKSMGASKSYIISAILRETVILAILGIGVGVAFSYTARGAIVAALFHPAHHGHAGMDFAGHRNRHHRRPRWRHLSGIQGRAERSHRRPRIRVTPAGDRTQENRRSILLPAFPASCSPLPGPFPGNSPSLTSSPVTGNL